MTLRTPRSMVRLLPILLAGALVATACSNSDDPALDDGADPPAAVDDEPAEITEPDAPGEPVGADALADLLPDSTRGVFALAIEEVRDGDSAADFAAVLDGDSTEAVFADVFAEMGSHTATVERDKLTRIMLIDPGDPALGRFVVARTDETELAALVGDVVDVEADDATGWAVGTDSRGRAVTLSPDGWFAAGSEPAVDAVHASVVAAESRPDLALSPYLDVLDDAADLAFAYGLPAFVGDVDRDRSLRGAVAMTGALEIAEGGLGGELAFHTDNAETFVASYNQLDRHALGADPDTAAPLTVEAGIDGRTDRVVVTVPRSPLVATPADAIDVRNLFKKLFVGMDAHDYAEDVVDGGAPWFDLIVKSEADGDDPPAPASVFFRWEFRDEEAVRAFEENELPEGYTIAPTRFFESDDPEGQIFFLLNIYNAGGGSIVGGARAEWDVYVNSPPGGPDPNPGERPRFFVVDALAETVSFDPVNLVTPAEPLSHDVVDGVVTSSVSRLENGVPNLVWESTFPQVDPTVDAVTRFTPEMAIGNDYIYWGGGAADRLLYNATTYNHDAYLVDPADVSFVHNTRWTEYLKPELLDVVYYVNTLEYIASPLVNLDSDQLDVTPEWRQELLGFKNNGHQEGLMRKRVDELFRGVGDAMVGYHVSNDSPTVHYQFEITDPAAFESMIELPAGHQLAPVSTFAGESPGLHLTLTVSEIDDSTEGLRAEWSTTTDPGNGRPKRLLLDLHTADFAIDPGAVFHLPDLVEQADDDGRLRTRIGSPSVSFEASLDLSDAESREVSTDWVETGDLLCRTNGICDAIYYDAETLDVPVGVIRDVDIGEMATPWDAAIDATPDAVFVRTNAQEYAAKRWLNLDVVVDELPFAGLADRTHEISGSGSLVGRDTEVVDSTYTYTGDAVLDGDQVHFAIDQRVESGLGVGNIFTTGSFDITTGTGTQTVVDCLGPALLCSDIVPGTTAIYTADALDASNPDEIAWRVDVTIVLSGSFGTADSASSLVASRSG